jgi:cytochrome c peroxidase
MKYLVGIALAGACAGCAVDGDLEVGTAESELSLPNDLPIVNRLGASATFSTDLAVDLDNEFLQDFGTNGRTCVDCHLPGQGWTISANKIEALFVLTRGRAPIFRLVDGANSPLADVSTYSARREAYSMLRTRGVIRVGIGIPDGAEFELAAVDDPYGYASAAELSLFRRPLPSANLGFTPTVMWDGRETRETLTASLAGQANGATLGHAEAAEPLTESVALAMVDFETALFNTQILRFGVGRLDRGGARGDPEFLVGKEAVAGRFEIFDAWIGSSHERRAAIARGQEIFNNPTSTGARCSGCHNVANVGNNTDVRFFNVSVSSPEIRPPDMPLYTLRNLETGEVRETTDPGRALITGLWSDVDRFKPPSLRGLSARAPYFHNGSAATLADVVAHYEAFVGFELTDQERADLVAFLEAL